MLPDRDRSAPGAKAARDLLDPANNQIEAHLITLCDALLLEAVSERASDLHIEQYKSTYPNSPAG